MEKSTAISSKKYEEENGTSWEEADKYEREDYVWSAYYNLKED